MAKSLLSKLANLKITNILIISFTIVIACSLTLQYILGYEPCNLCMQERGLYFYCLVISTMTEFSIRNHHLYWITFIFLMSITLIMIYNAALGINHVGIKLNIMPEITKCMVNKNALVTNTIDLMDNIKKQHTIPCNQVDLYILGLSLAFWNIVLSLTFSTISCISMIKVMYKKNPKFPK
ncbi:MAG: disulfide bond formation protein B [Candidatus Liberibacter europaeus]|uniref:Disulfide bond formation protein B n=1 Tax=Candidatus Liberibacter europaeus TaxID=744859 RepID=A0A2T4VXP1_9HYPH|nr:disulfide bond formation protein B [Candidatus Liberibacter europaeus]PTL86544.1 MAG: disulfide bond formation protein B [Candidatus Liberibacter europaeus]